MLTVCVQEEMGQSQEMVIADCVSVQEMGQSQEMVIAVCVCSGGDGAVPGDGDCCVCLFRRRWSSPRRW